MKGGIFHVLAKTIQYTSNVLLLLSAIVMFTDSAVGGLLIYLTIVVAGLGVVARTSSVANGVATVLLAVAIMGIFSHWTAQGAISPSRQSMLTFLLLIAAPTFVAMICFGIGMWRRRSPR